MTADLFAAELREAARPLADRMRPRSLGEFFGQAHLVAPGSHSRTPSPTVARIDDLLGPARNR